MKVETIKYSIDNWKRLGIQMITDENHKGWYIMFKRKNANNFFEKHAETADDFYKNEQIKIKDYPYVIVECKVTMETFLKDEISDDSDYLLKRIYEFHHFDDIIYFFKLKKYCDDDFVWLADLQYIE